MKTTAKSPISDQPSQTCWHHLSLCRAVRQELTSHPSFSNLGVSSWLAAISQNGGNFDSIPAWAWVGSGFSALPKECLNYQVTVWRLAKLCFAHWHHFQETVLLSPSLSLPPLLPDLPCGCVFTFLLLPHLPARFLETPSCHPACGTMDNTWPFLFELHCLFSEQHSHNQRKKLPHPTQFCCFWMEDATLPRRRGLNRYCFPQINLLAWRKYPLKPMISLRT